MKDFSKLRDEVFNNVFSAAGIVAGTIILYLVTFFIIKRWAKKRQRGLPSLLQDFIYYPGLLLTLMIACRVAIHFLEPYVSERAFNVLRHVVETLTITAFGFLAIRSITVLRELAIGHYKSENPGDFSLRKAKTKFQLIQRVLNFLIILATVAIILMTFKSIRSIGSSLLASAGVVGLVLGFAAQKSLGTLFAGIQIAIAQPIRIDDVVVVDNAFGTIGEITLTYVVVNSWDGRRIIVPINYFLEKSFENWTRVSPEVIGKVKVYADYTLPVDRLRVQFGKWLSETPLWDKRSSGLAVTGCNDKTIELRATMSAKSSDDAWDLECLIREKMVRYISDQFPDSLPKNRAMALTNSETIKN